MKAKTQKFQNQYQKTQNRLNELQDQYEITQEDIRDGVLKNAQMTHELEETKNH